MNMNLITSIESLENEERPHLVVDIRSAEDFHKETYPKARNLHFEEFPSDPAEIMKTLTSLAEVTIDNMMFEEDRPARVPVYLLCYTGEQSERIAENLQKYHIEAYSIEGGWQSYLRLEMKRLLDGVAPKAEEKHEENFPTADAPTADKVTADDPTADDPTADKLTAADLTEEELQGLSHKQKKYLRMSYAEKVEQSIRKKFKKTIWRRFTKAIKEYDLIQPGDKIAVCISGGKDSMLLAKLFQELSRHGIQNFEVVYLVMNPGYNDINAKTIEQNAKKLNIPITVFHTSIYDIVAGDAGYDGSGSPCYLCARMRRGWLYHKAQELGCNKIALGHHFDDVIETTLMGMLYSGQIQTMMPKLKSTNFPGMELIRPMYYIREQDIIHWRDYNDLHFINCACRLTESCASCGGTEQGSKRAEVKRLIAFLEKRDAMVGINLFRSMQNVAMPMILGYKTADGVHHSFLDNYDDAKASKEGEE